MQTDASQRLLYQDGRPTTAWVKAEDAEIDAGAKYLVKTNGGLWRDSDLFIMRGLEVRYKMRPEYVRGRPVLIARINDPTLSI